MTSPSVPGGHAARAFPHHAAAASYTLPATTSHDQRVVRSQRLNQQLEHHRYLYQYATGVQNRLTQRARTVWPLRQKNGRQLIALSWGKPTAATASASASILETPGLRTGLTIPPYEDCSTTTRLDIRGGGHPVQRRQIMWPSAEGAPGAGPPKHLEPGPALPIPPSGRGVPSPPLGEGTVLVINLSHGGGLRHPPLVANAG